MCTILGDNHGVYRMDYFFDNLYKFQSMLKAKVPSAEDVKKTLKSGVMKA